MRKSLYARIKKSRHPLVRLARAVVRGVESFTLPAPRVVTVPILYAYLAVRGVYGFAYRVFICEPIFKAYCTRFGRRVRTGDFIHWVQGRGDLIVGDDVVIDGKCGFTFAAVLPEPAAVVIGDRTVIGHDCAFVAARRIEIGRDCLIASGVWMFDSPGHPLDPEARAAGETPRPEDIKPITVRDNVWIGRRCVILPGVTVGEGSVVAAGSVVASDVAPYTMVAGYPARKIAALRNPSEPRPEPPAPVGTGPVPAEPLPSSRPGA
jgi:carbonic anhydrase/acetyltransferase-like protein (isoleucine patch superfamily)